ncbi:MAG: 4-phytase [Chloroflexi bacterium]|nr:4-phytase [Chloroflexota bacterium]
MRAFRLGAARWTVNGILLATLALTGCGPGQPRVAGPEAAPSTVPPTDAPPLVIFLGNQPNSLAMRPFAAKGRGIYVAWRMFNALPVLTDARGQPQPELLSSLPSLNTDSWQVFPDGTMQTTYTLRPNLTWHDGQPLTSDDFVFSWRVYSSPELGLASQPPMPAMADVVAIDRDRFVIHWKSLYPEADSLSSKSREFPALPQHVLGPAFDQIATGGRDAFTNHSVWGLQYVGLGPYRLQQWEAGDFIDAVRFDGYVLGAPKIPRIQLRFSSDQNVVLAHMLAGEAHVAADSSISQAAADALSLEWARSNGGTILSSPSNWRSIYFQLRPELANPRAILDPRVRKAVAHSVDREAIAVAIYGGHAITTDTPIWTGSAWGDVVDSSIPAYRLDPRATESLMNQAGFSKASDGFYRGSEGRLSPELATSESPDAVRELLAMANELQAAGLDIQQRVVPVALAQDAQLKATFPTMLVAGTDIGEAALNYLASTQIPTAGNFWQGLNRGGWSSPDYDRLLTSFNNTLDRATRVSLARQMMRVYGEDVPVISLLFPAGLVAHVAKLQGPANTAGESNLAWNVHQWEFK